MRSWLAVLAMALSISGAVAHITEVQHYAGYTLECGPGYYILTGPTSSTERRGPGVFCPYDNDLLGHVHHSRPAVHVHVGVDVDVR